MTNGVPTEATSGVWASVAMSSSVSPAQAATRSVGTAISIDSDCGAAMRAPEITPAGIAQDVHAHQAGNLLERVVLRRIAGHGRQDEAGADIRDGRRTASPSSG